MLKKEASTRTCPKWSQRHSRSSNGRNDFHAIVMGSPCHRKNTCFRIMYEITDTAGDHRLLIEQQLSRSFTNLRKVQGNSTQLCNEFLQLLAQDRTNRLGTDFTVEIENIKRSEESKILAQHHGSIMKSNRHGTLHEVLVPTPSSSATLEWMTITDEDKTYRVLLRRNMRKLLASTASIDD